jgi:hypothetical protein
MDLFFKLLIFFVVIVLGMGLARAFLGDLDDHGGKRTDGGFSFTVTNLLTFLLFWSCLKARWVFSRAPSQADIHR